MTTKNTAITVEQFDRVMKKALAKTDSRLLTPDELYDDSKCDGGVWPLKYAGERVAIRTKSGNAQLFYKGGVLGSGQERVYVDVGSDTSAEEELEITQHFITLAA